MQKILRQIGAVIRNIPAQLILLVLLVFFAVRLKGMFFTVDNLIAIIRQVTTLGIAALGVSFLMITANLDFSIGSIYAFVGVFTAVMYNLGWNIYLAMFVSILLGIALSVLTGWISITFKIPRLITSLAMLTAISGLAVIISGNKTIYGLPDNIKWLGQGYIWIIPISTFIFVILAFLVAFILNRTYLGRYLFAVGGNEDVARLSGINANKIKYIASIISGFLASLAGLVAMSRTFSGSPFAGGSLSTDVISAAVLGGVSIMGGTGKTSGLVTGIFIVGVLATGLNMMNMNTNAQNIIKGLMLLVAVVLDSWTKRKAAAAK
jgi:ribose/xylose/arabinose/galactoside ABC-type transport system permease subunit